MAHTSIGRGSRSQKLSVPRGGKATKFHGVLSLHVMRGEFSLSKNHKMCVQLGSLPLDVALKKVDERVSVRGACQQRERVSLALLQRKANFEKNAVQQLMK